jgi:peptide/nickel transport system ATP-binding protein
MRAGRIVDHRRLDEIVASDDAYVAGFFERVP